MKRGICADADPYTHSAKWYAHHDTIGCAGTLSGNIDFFLNILTVLQFLSCSLIKVLGSRRVRENASVFLLY